MKLQILLLLGVFPAGICTGVPDNEGREFIFAFGANSKVDLVSHALEVFVATRSENNVTFNYTNMGIIYTASVSPGSVYSYSLNTSQSMNETASEIIEEKAHFINAEDDIVVYATHKKEASVDAFLALPTDVLSTEYVVPAWQGRGITLIVVVAIHDGTTFNITLSDATSTDTLRPDVVINRGEVYQYTGSSPDVPGLYPRDVTGARIRSDKSIAVLSGNKYCRIKGTSSGDHLMEMIPPINTLGQEFLMANFFERESDVFRIIAADTSADVNIYRSSNVTSSTVSLSYVGHFEEIDTVENEVMHITSSGPVIVAQYSKTANADGAESDPMMAIVPPKEQYENFYTFTTPTGVIDPYRNYVNIIISVNETSGIRFDGNVVTDTLTALGFIAGDYFNATCWAQDSWMAIGDTGFTTRTLAILHGTHSLHHVNPTVTFYAMMYGQVKYESYGYPAGTRLASIGSYCTVSSVTVNDGVDNDCDGSIDEELADGLDDDGDGLIDEDTSANDAFPASTTASTTSTILPTTTTSSTTTSTVQDTTSTSTTTTSTVPDTTSTSTTTASTVQDTTSTLTTTTSTVQDTTLTSTTTTQPVTSTASTTAAAVSTFSTSTISSPTTVGTTTILTSSIASTPAAPTDSTTTLTTSSTSTSTLTTSSTGTSASTPEAPTDSTTITTTSSSGNSTSTPEASIPAATYNTSSAVTSTNTNIEALTTATTGTHTATATVPPVITATESNTVATTANTSINATSETNTTSDVSGTTASTHGSTGQAKNISTTSDLELELCDAEKQQQEIVAIFVGTTVGVVSVLVLSTIITLICIKCCCIGCCCAICCGKRNDDEEEEKRKTQETEKWQLRRSNSVSPATAL